VHATNAAQQRNMLHFNGRLINKMATRRHSQPAACVSPVYGGLHWQWQPLLPQDAEASGWPVLETSDQPPQRTQILRQQDGLMQEPDSVSRVCCIAYPREAYCSLLATHDEYGNILLYPFDKCA